MYWNSAEFLLLQYKLSLLLLLRMGVLHANLYSIPVWCSHRNRYSWLSDLVVLAPCAGAVVCKYAPSLHSILGYGHETAGTYSESASV